MSVLGLAVGMVLAWALGIAAVAAATRRARVPDAPGSLPWTLGLGWFVGSFLGSLWMRVLSAIHVPFGIASIVLPTVLFTAAAAWLAWPRMTVPWAQWRTAAARLVAPDMRGWQRFAWVALLAWLALRFLLLLSEIVRRPLFAWDAWTQWGTKARVWYELHRIAPFVPAPDWFAAGTPTVYFDAAPLYPATVPLFQTWAAIFVGRWDDTIVNVPWWITGVAFGLAIYGYLVRERFAPLPALVGTWLVLSLPIFDTHIALAGYADLAMATYLTLAALAALVAIRERDVGHALLAFVLAAACVLIKMPGKAWIVVMLPGLVLAASPRYGRRIAGGALGIALLGVLVLARTDAVVLGYRLHLDFEPPWRGLYEAYFAFGNWNVLWYGALAVALLAWRDLLAPRVAPYSLMVAAGILFLLFGFAFTNARIWVEDQSTVNRATLHLAPLVVIWMLVAFRAWSTRIDARASEPATPAATTVP